MFILARAQHITYADSWVAHQCQVLCLLHEIVLFQSDCGILFMSQIVHEFWYSYAHPFQPSECSSTVQITHWPSTVHGRMCSLVTGKELGYSALKPEQLEVIMAFVGGREVFVVVLWLGSGKASATAARLPIVFVFTAGQRPCYIL